MRVSHPKYHYYSLRFFNRFALLCLGICSLLLTQLNAANVVLPSNGGVLESFTSQLGPGYEATLLTNGVTNETGWSSINKVKDDQEFVYSFNSGYNASVTTVTVRNGDGEGKKRYSKDVEIWTSVDGTNFTLAGSGAMAKADYSTFSVNLGGAVINKIKLIVTKGHDKNKWQLAEFEVEGTVLYPLTVDSGTGSGMHGEGAVVNIVADAPAAGYNFDSWVVTTGIPLIADVNASTTTLTMPAGDAGVIATYSQPPVSGYSPEWVSNPTVKVNAQATIVYVRSVQYDAYDPDADPLTFAKVSGPAWLSVATDGSLTGTPTAGDVGLNSFSISAFDGVNAPVPAVVQITVDPEPSASASSLLVNHGILESATSELPGFEAVKLINGVTDEGGWSSEKKPDDQEIVFSFTGGYNANVTSATIHGGNGGGKYYSKDVEIWTSVDGTNYTMAGDGTLDDVPNETFTVNFGGGTVINKIKVVVTKGHDKNYWQLGEFEVNGAMIFPLTVNNGSGGGLHEAGSVVNITANAAPPGYEFNTWVPGAGSPHVVDLYSSATTLVMPESPASVDVLYVVPPVSGSNPVWHTNPVVKENAQATIAYVRNLDFDASDADGDPLTFVKTSGPVWLSVATDGSLTGTPSAGDVGLNTFNLTVSDGVNTPVVGVVEITVDEEPVITVQNLLTTNGVLESFTSEFDEDYSASALTNGITNEDGWASTEDPTVPQEFVYSFTGGGMVSLSDAVIHGGTAEGQYYSRDVQVWTSSDGTSYTLAGSGVLAQANNDNVTVSLGGVVVSHIKLVITSGYRTDYWELAEFEVNGSFVYPLTVVNGSGDGNYAENAVVNVVANAPAAGFSFDAWVVNTGNLTPGDVNASSTTVVMPGASAQLTATYNQIPVWSSDPLVKANALADNYYSSSVAADASDGEGDPLTFSKTSGPSWLAVSADGTIDGTPTSSDGGVNDFTVSVTDGKSSAVTATLRITVDGGTPNTVPTDIFMDSEAILEASSVSTVVGNLSTVDADVGDSHTYTLVAGAGSGDNASFSISGSSLLSAAVFDFNTKSSYSVRVRTDDGNGGTYEEAITITIHKLLEAPFPDMNEDGNADIILSHIVIGKIAFWHMDGNGNMTASQNLTGNIDDWVHVGYGDMNSDGHVDLLLQSALNGAVVVQHYDGTGNFLSFGNIAGAMTGWRVVAAGDMNNDGNDDILLRETTSNVVVVWYMDGNGVQMGVDFLTGAMTGWKLVGVGDINDDEYLDLLIQSEVNGTLAVHYMNGEGKPASVIETISPAMNEWVLCNSFDMNNDGIMDLIWQNDQTAAAAVWYMDGNGSSSNVELLPMITLYWRLGTNIQAGFDMQGKVNVYGYVIGLGGQISPLGDTILNSGESIVLTATPDDEFVIHEWYLDDVLVAEGVSSYTINNVTANHHIYVTFMSKNIDTDFDNDGNADLLFQNPGNGQVDLWYMDGAGTSEGTTTITVNSLNLEATVDLNNDGHTDILWQDPSDGGVEIWYMDGQLGTLWTRTIAASYVGWQLVTASDMNNDGYLDLLWRNTTDGDVNVWYQESDGAFLNGAYLALDRYDWHLRGAGDLNGDGNSDQVFQNNITGGVEVWHMNGSGGWLSTTNLLSSEADWDVIGLSDMNNDENLDILWQHSTSGDVKCWYMDGAGAMSSEAVIATGVGVFELKR